MTNPFNQSNFQITDDYLKRSIEAAAIPHTDYTAFSGRELPGELFLIVAEKDKFRDDEQTMICLMQRMIGLLLSNDHDLSDYDEEAITNFTNNFCLNRYYNDLEYTPIPIDYFMKEANWLFKAFEDEFRGKEITELLESPYGPLGFFKNKQPLGVLEKTNPVGDEVILKAYSLVDYHDGKYFFAISETNYILLNWQSGGPMHLLAKPAKRIPGSLLLSGDAFYEALGIKKDPG
ncbi:MAG TPA: hypothetical protein VIV35_09340 [Chitinophagaceae bacterium]